MTGDTMWQPIEYCLSMADAEESCTISCTQVFGRGKSRCQILRPHCPVSLRHRHNDVCSTVISRDQYGNGEDCGVAAACVISEVGVHHRKIPAMPGCGRGSILTMPTSNSLLKQLDISQSLSDVHMKGEEDQWSDTQSDRFPFLTATRSDPTDPILKSLPDVRQVYDANFPVLSTCKGKHRKKRNKKKIVGDTSNMPIKRVPAAVPQTEMLPGDACVSASSLELSLCRKASHNVAKLNLNNCVVNLDKGTSSSMSLHGRSTPEQSSKSSVQSLNLITFTDEENNVFNRNSCLSSQEVKIPSFENIDDNASATTSPSLVETEGSSSKHSICSADLAMENDFELNKLIAISNAEPFDWTLKGRNVIQIEGISALCDPKVVEDFVSQCGTIINSELRRKADKIAIRYRLKSAEACEFAVSCLHDTDCIYPDTQTVLLCFNV